MSSALPPSPPPSFPPAPVPSPCNGVCSMDGQTGWCRGCLRSLEEIAGWGNADEERRRAIWRDIAQRRRQAASAS